MIWRVLEQDLRLQAGPGLVGPQAILAAKDRRHGGDAACVQFLQAGNMLKNSRKLNAIALFFLGGQIQPGESCDMFNFLQGKRHAGDYITARQSRRLSRRGGEERGLTLQRRRVLVVDLHLNIKALVE